MRGQGTSVSVAGSIRRCGSDQQGMVLIELLVAMPMALLVVGSVFGIYNYAVQGEAAVGSRAHAIVQAKNGIEQLGRDLRQAKRVVTGPATGPGWSVAAGSVWIQKCAEASCTSPAEEILWNCNAANDDEKRLTDRACTRTVGDTSRMLVENLVTSGAGASSFSPPGTDWQATGTSPPGAPPYVNVTISVAVKRQVNPITVRDGIELRNIPLS